MNLLELNDISVDFTTKKVTLSAVKDVSLTIGKGDFISIVGPSGCGKSTLLNVLGGFLPPSGGTIFQKGEALKGPGRNRGVVFQKPALYPWLNVEQNVGFGLKMRGIGKKEKLKIVEENLKRVQLSDFSHMNTYELSGGMQQRVAIARILANDPEILLMDEPFGALDVLTREHLQDELLKIWRETHKTVVLITHSVEEAIYLSTSVYVMSELPGQLIKKVETPFSTEYSEMNSRKIKSLPEFVALREEVLSYIWS
ncbi:MULTISPECIES: ABC transporter ATP-binding protein [unclassified Oceanispirochaeta]|uniref:ABC transporter ATP-binding protein n=1 Tax=unclassified Oceanispirochaeta TaxID=2635722 RepID=UPI000E095971|nr:MULTISPECIES: ABC transporter ATP-binding protein [unclassified Oceanispirochaeta]MBF9015999.1 ABC transporter ATP-binding protein [Oceanispirochaeta sp. M2]NPD72462.1 ABC transporter ATP-binding protein [Oceanispirochaeta sp. M1]RDG31921.1 ABC transporter ATP-binding protein [Oceanispirochaeta sp. M1]